MTIDLKASVLEQKRQTFAHIARRLGDRTPTRYDEAVYDVQATDNFHYRPLWGPEFELYDPNRTAIKMEDWYAFRDPRQFYYGTYTIARANMNQATERNFDFVQKRGMLEALAPDWREKATLYLLPLRHYEWGANMNAGLIADYGYGAAITSAAAFSMMDRLGNAQVLSRIGLALDGNTGESLNRAKEHWLGHAALQGLREIVENTFVIEDWFETLVAQYMALDTAVYGLVYGRIDGEAQNHGGIALSMLCEFILNWDKEHRRWIDAVIKIAAQESSANRALLSDWCRKWAPAAAQALRPLAAEILGAAGSDAIQQVADASRARAKKLGLNV